MPFRPTRLAFLPPLLLFQLAGNAQAMPVRNDEPELQPMIESIAELREAPEPATQIIPGPGLAPVAASSRPIAENAAKAMEPASAFRASEFLAGENSSSQAKGSSDIFREPDPLAHTLRSIVNVTRRQDAPGSSPRSAPGDTQFGTYLDDDSRAAVREVKELLADAIRTALDPRAEEDGRITFSIAGIEGFHILADGDSWSLGLGDTVLTTVQRQAREGENGEYPAIRRAAFQTDYHSRDKNGLRDQPYPVAANPIAQAIALVKEVIEHPLTWFFMVIFITFRIAAAIRSTRVAPHRR